MLDTILASRLRPLAMALLGVLVSLGVLPPSIEEHLEAHADHLVGVILLAWAVVTWLRNRKERAAHRPNVGGNG